VGNRLKTRELSFCRVQKSAKECARVSNKRTYDLALAVKTQRSAQALEKKSLASWNGFLEERIAQMKVQVNLVNEVAQELL
jgi:hypothetical protein